MFAKSILFFLSVLITAAAYSGCPDPSEIKIQTGTDRPRFITNSGWISDAEANGLREPRFVPIMAIIFNFNPPASEPLPQLSIRCQYNITDGNKRGGVFNLYPPYFQDPIKHYRVSRHVQNEWSVDADKYAMCRFSLEKGRQCGFTVEGAY